MLPATTPRRKPKSPGVDAALNPKTCVTCTNVPEGLFDTTAAKRHFSKFGKVHKIRLVPKRQACIVEYEQPVSAERAVLNAGAFDGFMFDVTRSKPRVRKRSKKEDDPDWVPDSDVEDELSAMSGAPTYRMTRQNQMDIEPETSKPKLLTRVIKHSPVRKKVPVRDKQPATSQVVSGIESPVPVAMTQTTLSTFEAAAELHYLCAKVSLTPDEQWRVLDARDRILRGWGGAGSRVKIGGATIGTCQDMCPEKELLHRQAEHQVMTLETVLDSDGQLETWRAVKQYSRSSADQEMPMCYELRPASVLMRTCSYLLHEIADTTRQVTLADWFHFMWDRFRSIRKDITQQALCCAESIRLVEMCARFHAHCAARLADLEHTQFDQKLNTDNLTKCLQTLKHMYADVTADKRPREAEFRGYIALLNLGDANFWWEIKQLPKEIQKSAPIVFAIHVFNALDNNNYVRFFRLIKERATYLQACILLRYFNDVRARALARIVKAYAPRGGSRFPASDLMNALAFESIENMKSFTNHYGLRFAKADDYELSIILDRNQFIEDSDPFPIARSIKLIESKRQSTVGEVIAGGPLPSADYTQHVMYTSFTKDGKLKETALVAEDQGFNTVNDSNKDVNALKAEIQRLAQGGKNYGVETVEPRANLFVKPEPKAVSPRPKMTFTVPTTVANEKKLFSFKPAITVAPTDAIKNSPEEKKLGAEAKNAFSFSKPQDTGANLFASKDTGSLFDPAAKSLFGNKENPESNILFGKKTEHDPKSLFGNKAGPDSKTLFGMRAEPVSKPLFGNTIERDPRAIFGRTSNDNKEPFQSTQNVFKSATSNENIFNKPAKSVFGQEAEPKQANMSNNLFASKTVVDTNNVEKGIFNDNSVFSVAKENSLFTKSDAKFEKGGNIFAKPAQEVEDATKRPANIFATFSKAPEPKNIFAPNGESNQVSPGTLFKTAFNPPNNSDAKSYSIFQSKNKAQTVADNILNSVVTNNTIYDFNQNDDEEQRQLSLQRLKEEQIREEERLLQERLRKEEERKQQELRLLEEERRKEEARKKQEEIRLLEEKRRREEERKQEELRKRLEEERIAELKRKAEEKERKFKKAVEKESTQLVEELVIEVNNETSRELVKEEQEKLRKLVKYAKNTSEEIIAELCDDICLSEMKAEMFLTQNIMKKWFCVWRQQYIRNFNRRRLLDDTPVWLPERTPREEAPYLRRSVEDSALKNMNDIHKGYKFVGELKQLPPPEPFNLMEIIRSPLLKRMKQICYPYDKCFFWKVTLVAPGEDKWMCRKINVQKWLIDAFSDRKKHEESETLVYVAKQSWNHLMDFAISVSRINKDKMFCCVEAVEGTNGILFYFTERDCNFIETIQQTLSHKYPYQVVPVAVIMPKTDDQTTLDAIQDLLTTYANNQIISGFKIFVLDPQNISQLLHTSTKTALRWLAKKYPQTPPLEIDSLKSMCQRYLGNEIWCRFRHERDNRMGDVLKDINKLIRCYNAAVDKLIDVITNEDLFNYATFPLELKAFLDNTSPYPKPYEFIPSNVRTSENVNTIRDILKQLKLPSPSAAFNPLSVVGMQQQIRTYCNQIGWFENPEEVVCKVVAVIPNELSDLNMTPEDFTQYFAHYDLIDFLNILVYEKINNLNRFDNRFAIYEKAVLREYSAIHWLYELEVLSQIKHKAIEYEDELDYFIEAKRRKIAIDSQEYLMLEDKDSTIVEENIKDTDANITKYSNCSTAVKQLEKEIEEGKKKSIEFENMLRAALADV